MFSCADGCILGTFDEIKLGVRLGEMVGFGLDSKLGPEDKITLGVIDGTSLLLLGHSLGYKLGYATGLLLGRGVEVSDGTELGAGLCN